MATVTWRSGRLHAGQLPASSRMATGCRGQDPTTAVRVLISAMPQSAHLPGMAAAADGSMGHVHTVPPAGCGALRGAAGTGLFSLQPPAAAAKMRQDDNAAIAFMAGSSYGKPSAASPNNPGRARRAL